MASHLRLLSRFYRNHLFPDFFMFYITASLLPFQFLSGSVVAKLRCGGYIVHCSIRRSIRIMQLQKLLKSGNSLRRNCVMSAGAFYFEPPCIWSNIVCIATYQCMVQAAESSVHCDSRRSLAGCPSQQTDTEPRCQFCRTPPRRPGQMHLRTTRSVTCHVRSHSRTHLRTTRSVTCHVRSHSRTHLCTRCYEAAKRHLPYGITQLNTPPHE